VEHPNSNLQFFLDTFSGYLTAKQRSAILNGLELTARLERYAEQALGQRRDLVETKKNTIIWSPPGAGKTFTVRNVAQQQNIDYVKFHGRASLNAFVMKMAKALYLHGTRTVVPVWIDDCDSFFTEKASLDFMKIVLDNDEPAISWDVNVSSQITRAEKMGDLDLVAALRHWDNGGVGILIPADRCRFIITTNKKLASKQEIGRKKTSMDEHAIRDRVNWRSFDITDEESWGWMSSVMLSNNVFQEDGFQLNPMQMFQLLNTFHKNWSKLNANSMRTVKEAGAILYNSPDTFADEFEQNFLV
jgi:hypothetical protein